MRGEGEAEVLPPAAGRAPDSRWPRDVDPAGRPKVAMPAFLYLATWFTTTAQGALAQTGSMFPLASGFAYSVPLMAILTCHEFGHFFVARFHRVPASLPYFIPLPPGFGMFGTMGAIIRMPARIESRRALIDIGAAGPIAGLLVAVPLLVHGVDISPVRVLSEAGWQEGNSIGYALIKYAIKGEWLPADGRDVILHPTAFAAWVGLFITMLNLLPIGQLDGGHVATAYFGNRYAAMARRLHSLLPLVALIAFAMVYLPLRAVGSEGAPAVGVGLVEIALMPAFSWLVWWGLLGAMGRATGQFDHPPVDDSPLPRSRVRLFWAMVVTYVLIFMPVPLHINAGASPPSGRDIPTAPAEAAP